VLDHVITLLTTAERSADRIADLCRRGEPVDNAVGELSAAVAAVVAVCPNGLPPELQPRWHTLTERVATATYAAQTRSGELAAELEQTARQDRVRRAYARPPG
jgi:hypothetical protein